MNSVMAGLTLLVNVGFVTFTIYLAVVLTPTSQTNSTSSSATYSPLYIFILYLMYIATPHVS